MVPPKSQNGKSTKRRVKRLSVFFRAFLTINSLFCIGSLLGQNCPIRLEISTIPAKCQADGEIHCTLHDTTGSRLSQIRYAYIPLAGEDSILKSTLPSVTHLWPGHYKVRVTALCQTGLSQGDAYTLVSDSVEDVLVESDYEHPVSGVIYPLFTREHPYGTVPSLRCKPTGKIQLKIERGTLPYTVEISRISGSDTLFWRSVTFTSPQHTGDDPLRYDFRDYYTIDSLPVGEYRFLCHDACGYHTPALTAPVPEVRYNLRNQKFLLRNSSGDIYSHNVITIKNMLIEAYSSESNDDYYHYSGEAIYEYRFLNPAVLTGPDTTSWYNLPPSSTQGTFIRDTVSQANCYCNIWFKPITMQVRPKACEDTLVEFHFTIYPQGQITDNLLPVNRLVLATQEYYDTCGYQTARYENVITGLKLFSQRIIPVNIYMPADSLNHPSDKAYTLMTEEGGIPNSTVGMQYHSYVTLPVTWKVTNATTDTVLFSDMESTLDYSWILSSNVTSGVNAGDTLIVEIVDAHGCPVHATTIVYKPEPGGGIASYYRNYDWATTTQDFKEYCPDGRYGVGVFQINGAYGLSRAEDGTRKASYRDVTVELVGSPRNNFYNFTTHTDSIGHLTTHRQNTDNHANIEIIPYKHNGSNRPLLLLSDTALPNGRYTWVVTSACNRSKDTLVQDFLRESPEIAEPPAYQFRQQCTRLEITPIAGQFAKGGQNLQTYFQVYLGDSIIHSANAVVKGEPLLVGVAGDYRLSMYTLPQGGDAYLPTNPCFHVDTIIHWDGATLDFKYLYSYVCNSADTTGFVHSKARGGSEPYIYRLFAQPDGQGPLIAQNSTGYFEDVPLRFMQNMSVQMEDACNAHFLTNFRVSDMESIRKCWLEDGEATVGYEVGDTCHLHGLAMEEFTYHWTGPNGFESQQRDVNLLLSLTDEGMYHIDIIGSGCGILHDSVLVRIQDPWVNLPCPDAVDYDGNIYPAVRIGHYCWTQRNLESQHYADGRKIPRVMGYASDMYPDTLENIRIFGCLYTWRDAMDSLKKDSLTAGGHHPGICPDGWYLPEREQYEALSLYGAYALRSPLYWINDSGGNNSTQFSALPAGFYNGTRKRFENLLGETRFWSTSGDENSENTLFFSMTFPCHKLEEKEDADNFGYSIRCILEE